MPNHPELYSYRDELVTLKYLSKISGISVPTLRFRLVYMSVEDAIRCKSKYNGGVTEVKTIDHSVEDAVKDRLKAIMAVPVNPRTCIYTAINKYGLYRGNDRRLVYRA